MKFLYGKKDEFYYKDVEETFVFRVGIYWELGEKFRNYLFYIFN